MNSKAKTVRQSTSKIAPINSGHGLLLDDILVEHGPPDILGRFFLEAYEAARERGVELSFASFDDLAEVNREQTPDWPLLPMFRPGASGLQADRSLCILGRNAQGDIVATQAARCYNWTGSNLTREAESLRIFYNDDVAPPNASCRVSAQAGPSINNKVVYSGAGWYRPDVRGRELSAILPRISRACALTKWDTDFTISFVDWKIVHKGVAARYGYRRIEAGIEISNVIGDEFNAALAWMPRAELIEDLQWFLAEFPRKFIDASSKEAVTSIRSPDGALKGKMSRR